VDRACVRRCRRRRHDHPCATQGGDERRL